MTAKPAGVESCLAEHVPDSANLAKELLKHLVSIR